MGLRWVDWPPEVLASLRTGVAIPAHTAGTRRVPHTLDLRRQRALTRYYLDAGSGGLAFGVHTNAVCHPRGRALPAGARPRHAHQG